MRDVLMTGVPAWVLHTGQLATYLLDRLAQCRLVVLLQAYYNETFNG